MTRPWTLGWLVTGLAAALVLAAAGAGMAAMASAVATPQVPAQYCSSHPAPVLRALKEGAQRVVVVLKAFEPTKAGGARLVVSLLTANKTKRHEVARIAVHPLRAFSAHEPRRSQRFLVSLAGHGHLIEDGQPLCLEVAFDARGAKAEGGRAEIEIELAEMPPAK